MQIAEDYAKRSTARRLKVGCVITDKDNHITANGVNHMPEGFGDNCEIEDCEGNLVTRRELIHAEADAICKCAKDFGPGVVDGSIYVTHSPCMECAKLIVASGIKNVYFKEKYRLSEGLDFLVKNGISVTQLIY